MSLPPTQPGKLSLLTHGTEFICISLSSLGHCGSDSGRASCRRLHQLLRGRPQKPHPGVFLRGQKVTGPRLWREPAWTPSPTPFWNNKTANSGRKEPFHLPPFCSFKCLQVAPHHPASVLVTPTITRHPMGLTAGTHSILGEKLQTSFSLCWLVGEHGAS